MPVLLLILLVSVLLFLWLTRRGTTLTRLCRWREDRSLGQWRCAACGALCQVPAGKTPRHCLRPLNGHDDAGG